MSELRYSDLISFEPIDDIIKLKESGVLSTAKKLVSSYVVSEAMAAKLEHVIATNLDLNSSGTPKGVQIVGNYGTGKSHLLSVIGALAEHETLHLEKCEDPSIDASMDSFRGKYVVIRLTIGASLNNFRDIVFSELQSNLKEMGVVFEVPPLSKVNENITVFSNMMNEFQKKFPGKGLLIIIDELLDYLRSQDNQSRTLTVNFLREAGEFCGDSNFRFIAGLQASLFGDSGLSADPDLTKNLARVKDRFQTLDIDRTDISTVISRRMLIKSDEQKSQIRSLLQKYTESFENLERDMDTFVDLWPVHPKFLEIFHKIHISEKRQVFNEVADFISSKLEVPVPKDRPGLLTYDVHWPTLANKKEFEALPDVREVKNSMETIESRITQMEDWQQLPALSLVRALAIHRFTTPNIKIKVGLTANELRTDIFPWLPNLPQKDSATMTEMILSLLTVVRKVCRGELLNEKDGQWFLDLDLTQNWDHLVEEYRAQLSNTDKNRYYNDVIRQVLLGNISRETDVPNHQIFSHELEWKGHGVVRPGWLFFGAPNERPTAKPARDYYIYILSPWVPENYTDEKKDDEIFIQFKGKNDKQFKEYLEKYASAKSLALTHPHGRNTLKLIADEAFKGLVKWMDNSFTDKAEVRWKGTSKAFTDWTDEAKVGTVEERFETVTSHLINPHFSNKYPKYPSFDVSTPITKQSRIEMASSAVKAIANSKLDDTSSRILDGLEMLRGNGLDVSGSQYVQRIETILTKKKMGEVVNFAEIFNKENERYFSKPDMLEPEWIIVILAGLIYKGSATITYPAIGEINIDRIGELVYRKGEKFWSFTHVGRPKGLDIAALKAICRVLSIPPGKISEEESKLKGATTIIQEKASDMVESILGLKQWIVGKPELWSMEIIEDSENISEQLEQFKKFLDGLSAYDKPAKWANLKKNASEIETFFSTKLLVSDLQERRKAKDRLEKSIVLLSKCEDSMPSTHPWVNSILDTKKSIQKLWASPIPFPSGNVQNVASLINNSLSSYRKEYQKLHNMHRLDFNHDKQKKALLEGDRIETLRRISALDIFNEGSLDGILDRLASLQPCWNLEDKDLKNNAICPYCDFSPAIPDPPRPISGSDIDDIDEKLTQMEESWATDMLNQLQDPTLDRTVLTPTERSPLENFEKAKVFPKDSDTLSQLIAGADRAFSGLIRIVITPNELQKAIVGLGEALSPTQMQDRFSKFIEEMTKGQPSDKVRIIVKDEEDDA